MISQQFKFFVVWTVDVGISVVTGPFNTKKKKVVTGPARAETSLWTHHFLWYCALRY